VPTPADAAHWKMDRALLRSQHARLVEAVRYRFVDLLFGIASHDLYHVGQIQVLKRLYEPRRRRAK
jgi:hypothetical protein